MRKRWVCAVCGVLAVVGVVILGVAQDGSAIIEVAVRGVIEASGGSFRAGSQRIVLDLEWCPIDDGRVVTSEGSRPLAASSIEIGEASLHVNDPKYPHYAVPAKFKGSEGVKRRHTAFTLSGETADKEGAIGIAIPRYMRGQKARYNVSVKVLRGSARAGVFTTKNVRIGGTSWLTSKSEKNQVMEIESPRDEDCVFVLELSKGASVSGMSVTGRVP